MSEKQLKELQEYNLEYLEALNNEETYDGDYISAVELKYAKKEIQRLKEEYIMLQNASDEVEEEKDNEIERLKDLCNKYEEEHKTTFEEWKKAINIIKEVREYANNIKFETKREEKIQDDILEILGGENNDK